MADEEPKPPIRPNYPLTKETDELLLKLIEKKLYDPKNDVNHEDILRFDPARKDQIILIVGKFREPLYEEVEGKRQLKHKLVPGSDVRKSYGVFHAWNVRDKLDKDTMKLYIDTLKTYPGYAEYEKMEPADLVKTVPFLPGDKRTTDQWVKDYEAAKTPQEKTEIKDKIIELSMQIKLGKDVDGATTTEELCRKAQRIREAKYKQELAAYKLKKEKEEKPMPPVPPMPPGVTLPGSPPPPVEKKDEPIAATPLERELDSLMAAASLPLAEPGSPQSLPKLAALMNKTGHAF